MSERQFDMCADCGHHRGEHDGVGCTVLLIDAGVEWTCSCEGWKEAVDE